MKYKIKYGVIHPSFHDRRQLSERVYGEYTVHNAENQAHAKEIFRKHYPGRTAGAMEWYRIIKIERL